MAAHTSPTATWTVPVQPDQPPSGTAAWLREIARGANSVNGRIVAEQQARIDGDQNLQTQIDGITTGTGIVGPPGPTGPPGPPGPTAHRPVPEGVGLIQGPGRSGTLDPAP